jgi:hypothetical protein
MRMRSFKSTRVLLAALSLLTAVSLAPAPASAQWRGGGFHGGFGAWHGGGWGGGWRGGGWGGGWRGGWGGWRGGYGWGGPGWGYGGWGWGVPWWGYPVGWGWGPSVVVVNDGGPSGAGCWVYRRVWTRPHGQGRYLGRRLVNVCG